MKINKHTLVSVVAITIIVLITAYLAIALKRTPQISLVDVKRGNLTQGVSADGQVSAAQDLNLAFQQGGIVSEVDVKAGDMVKKGQTLVRLDNKDASATVSQATATLDIAEANLQKILNGATSADVEVAQTTLDNAKKNQQATTDQQNLIVKNSLATLLNSNLAAIPASNNISNLNPTISGAYNDTAQGQYQIKIYSSGNGFNFAVTGLENYQGLIVQAPVALGKKGLFIQFPAGQLYTNDSWTINIPNTQGSNYLANLNSYNSALQTQNQANVAAQAAVDSAQSALSLKQTAARPEDIATAKAQVEAASAQLQSAQNLLNKSFISAPIDGIITSVDTKVGQTVAGSTIAPGPAVIKMISAQKFQIISYLSETDIGKIKIGDTAQVTLDAYGSGVNFEAEVISIDPSATMNKGIPTYKTTLEFKLDDSRIKEGMNANITINDQNKTAVLIIPSTAIIKKGNQEFVLTQNAQGTIEQTEIKTGISDLNGNVEVTSGLTEGQKIASFGNQ